MESITGWPSVASSEDDEDELLLHEDSLLSLELLDEDMLDADEPLDQDDSLDEDDEKLDDEDELLDALLSLDELPSGSGDRSNGGMRRKMPSAPSALASILPNNLIAAP